MEDAREKLHLLYKEKMEHILLYAVSDSLEFVAENPEKNIDLLPSFIKDWVNDHLKKELHEGWHPDITAEEGLKLLNKLGQHD